MQLSLMEYRRLGSTGLKVLLAGGRTSYPAHFLHADVTRQHACGREAQEDVHFHQPTSPLLVCLQVSVLSFGAWVTFGTQVSSPRQHA